MYDGSSTWNRIVFPEVPSAALTGAPKSFYSDIYQIYT